MNDNRYSADDTVTDPLRCSMFYSGKITDAETSEPLPYATIGISHSGQGNGDKHNGDFILRISEECLEDTLSVSYVGYINRRIPVRSLPGNVYDNQYGAGISSPYRK